VTTMRAPPGSDLRALLCTVLVINVCFGSVEAAGGCQFFTSGPTETRTLLPEHVVCPRWPLRNPSDSLYSFCCSNVTLAEASIAAAENSA